MTEIATVGPSSGALALRSDQVQFNEHQRAALAQIGVDKAGAGDLAVLMHVSQRTGLDPFSRQIYMIERGGKWTLQTGIDGFRVIAERRPEYAGQTAPEWCGEDGEWRGVWTSAKPPAAARVGVLRTDRPTTWGIANFAEFSVGNSMWKGKPAHMIAKCAEALALRKAFPNDLAGLMTPEEADRDDMPRRGRSSAVVDSQPVTAQELTGGTPVPAGDVDARMTNEQQKKLFAGIRDAGIENRNAWASQLLGRDITSFGQLSIADASHLIDAVERGLAALRDDDPAAEQ